MFVGCCLFPTQNIRNHRMLLCGTFKSRGLRNCNYVFFVLSSSLHYGQIAILHMLTTSRAVKKGLTEMQGSMVLSCIGIVATIGRFTFSWVSNMKCTSHISLYTACVFCLSALIALSCIKPENIIFSGVILGLCGLMVGKSHTNFITTLF